MIKNKNGERIIIGISEVHLAELEHQEFKNKNTFYCKIHTGSMESIEEWNETQKQLDLTNLSEKEKQDILFPPVCEKQCFDCIAEVVETRNRTKELIDNQIKSKLWQQ